MIKEVIKKFPHLMARIENDSDVVIAKYRLGFIKQLWLKGKKHIIKDIFGKGRTIVTCPVTGIVYEHTITCPNKFELICRGCGERI